VQEELQEDAEASALVDEVVAEAEGSQEAEAGASHQEAEVVQEVAFLVDVVNFLTPGCVDILAFWAHVKR